MSDRDSTRDETRGMPDGDVECTPSIATGTCAIDATASDATVLVGVPHRQTDGVAVTYLGP